MSTAVPTLALHEIGSASRWLSHAQLHVVWAFEGQLDLQLDGGTTRLAPGHSVVVAPGRRRALAAPRSARCFVVGCSSEHHLQRLLPLAGRVRATDPAVGYLLRYLAAQPAWSASAAELLLDSVSAAGEPAPPRHRRAIDWPQLLGWIDRHLADPLDVAALAAQVHLSPTQFTARCTAEFGCAPIALVRRQRLAAALRLRAGGLPVGMVAARCGYHSPSALTAALRRDASPR
ncbi:MAG TPA: AraC family transcriptional regulator [Burkholderiaceae bacterium]|nr:AraC family transcriptional regulator [Burkholderiaceae bacterium]